MKRPRKQKQGSKRKCMVIGKRGTNHPSGNNNSTTNDSNPIFFQLSVTSIQWTGDQIISKKKKSLVKLHINQNSVTRLRGGATESEIDINSTQQNQAQMPQQQNSNVTPSDTVGVDGNHPINIPSLNLLQDTTDMNTTSSHSTISTQNQQVYESLIQPLQQPVVGVQSTHSNRHQRTSQSAGILRNRRPRSPLTNIRQALSAASVVAIPLGRNQSDATEGWATALQNDDSGYAAYETQSLTSLLSGQPQRRNLVRPPTPVPPSTTTSPSSIVITGLNQHPYRRLQLMFGINNTNASESAATRPMQTTTASPGTSKDIPENDLDTEPIKIDWKTVGTKLKMTGADIELELTCEICRDLFCDATTLNCSHTFCYSCLQRWRHSKASGKNTFCPKCNTPILSSVPCRVIDTLIDIIVGKSDNQQDDKRRKQLRDKKKLEVNALEDSIDPRHKVIYELQSLRRWAEQTLNDSIKMEELLSWYQDPLTGNNRFSNLTDDVSSTIRHDLDTIRRRADTLLRQDIGNKCNHWCMTAMAKEVWGGFIFNPSLKYFYASHVPK